MTQFNDTVQLNRLTQLFSGAQRFCALTGAGCSTESGLPAYRDDKGDWKHTKPMEHRDFVGSDAMRKFYWARSMQGWPNFQKAQPSQTHDALTRLQKSGHVSHIITQNVDRLHQISGSKNVIDLHGRLDQVVCLECHQVSERQMFQKELEKLNAAIEVNKRFIRPDGDVEIDSQTLENFNVPVCQQCQGVLKPNVVFFGDVLNAQTAQASMKAIEQAEGLMVVGSSLMVFSGFRLVKRAVELGKPVVIINRGMTRADDLYSLKIKHESGVVLNQLIESLALTG